MEWNKLRPSAIEIRLGTGKIFKKLIGKMLVQMKVIMRESI